MLKYAHIQAVIVRMILSFITANAASINATLGKKLNSVVTFIGLWNRFEVVVYLKRNIDGRWVFHIKQIRKSHLPQLSYYYEKFKPRSTILSL